MDEKYKRKLWEIVVSKFLTSFELPPSFQKSRDGQARHISRLISSAEHDSFVRFPKEYGRRTTLLGIYYFLRKQTNREHLITAFGRRLGNNSSRFNGFHYSLGNHQEVSVTPRNRDYIDKHTNSVENSEILFCHNHPSDWFMILLNSLFDLSPLPSEQDRNTALDYQQTAFEILLRIGERKRFQFYLVDDDEMLEFNLPMLPYDEGITILKQVFV